MKILQAIVAAGVFVVVAGVTGCTRLSIPAPEDFVKPMAEPAVENSTITLPVSISLTTISPDIDRLLQGNNGQVGSTSTGSIAGRLQKYLNRQMAKIDTNTILSSERFRQEVGRIWNVVQNPILLADDFYLLLEPKGVGVAAPITSGAQNDSITIILGLIARPKLIVGTLPKMSMQPLPDLISMPSASGFHIAIESQLPLDFLNRELTSKLKGREFSVNDKKIVIENVRIYCSGNEAVLAIKVKGSLKGTVFFSGTPMYDATDRDVVIKNLDYTVDTNQVLAKFADWFFHTKLRESLSTQAKWHIGNKIDGMHDLLLKALNRNLDRHVTISGAINKIRPVAVGMTTGSFKAIFIADGTAELIIQ